MVGALFRLAIGRKRRQARTGDEAERRDLVPGWQANPVVRQK